MRQTMILTGDLMLRSVTDTTKPFSRVADVLNEADVVFGNLEGALYDSDHSAGRENTGPSGTALDISQAPPLKARRYDAPSAAAPALTIAGFDAVGCANNVTYGAEAIAASLALLDELGIELSPETRQLVEEFADLKSAGAR